MKINYVIEIQKVLIKLDKEKACEVLGNWRRACARHFYGAATFTLSGVGEVNGQNFSLLSTRLLTNIKIFPTKFIINLVTVIF